MNTENLNDYEEEWLDESDNNEEIKVTSEVKKKI